MYNKRPVGGPLFQIAYGLAHVLEGLCVILTLGHYHPTPTFWLIGWAAERKS